MALLYIIIIGLITAAAVYAFIPDFILHHLGVGAWKRQFSPGVTITFDDGPNPEITPQILDILDQYKVKATFFVIGEKAARYPELIKLIHGRGHDLGAHTQHHRFAWLISPRTTWQEWDQCVAALEDLTGEAVEWMRPPWGTFSLSTWWWMKSRNKKAVLWDVEGHDWQVRRSPEQIIDRILKKVREGSIILLHDAGGEKGAPDNTLSALGLLCQKVTEDKNLPLVALALPQWTACRRLTQKAWAAWERFFARLYHIERIDSNNVFRLSKARYNGPNLYSPSGQLLAQKGDLVGEIHFDNSRLFTGTSSIQQGIHLLAQVKSSVPGLARYVTENPEYRDVKVFCGLTLINQGAWRFGFQVQEMPPTISVRLAGLLQKVLLLLLISPERASYKKLMHQQPKLVWISKEQLLHTWHQGWEDIHQG